jgi:hypothetical protein
MPEYPPDSIDIRMLESPDLAFFHRRKKGMSKRWIPVLLVISALGLSALTCGGTITTLHNKSNEGGHIELRLSREDGEIHQDIPIDKNWTGVLLHAEATLTVGEGGFTGFLVDGRGNRHPLNVAVGEPAQWSGDLLTDGNGGVVLLGAGESARDIFLVLDYRADNPPKRQTGSDSN